MERRTTPAEGSINRGFELSEYENTTAEHMN
jgi:hypothetical protein